MNGARHSEAPPVGEELHLPGPSLVPLINAAGLALALFGLTFSVVLVIAGVVVFLASTARWIADVRRDIEDLPPEHHELH